MNTRRKTIGRPRKNTPVPVIEDMIFIIRGHRVMLDCDIAQSTKRLKEQVRRNLARFPEDFMLQLTLEEAKEFVSSRSQIAILKRGQNIKHAPYAFTEHGAIMLATILNSAVAVQASVHVVRAFVRMRAVIMEYAKLARRVDVIERECNGRFKEVFAAIRHLMNPPLNRSRTIGFIRPPKAQK